MLFVILLIRFCFTVSHCSQTPSKRTASESGQPSSKRQATESYVKETWSLPSTRFPVNLNVDATEEERETNPTRQSPKDSSHPGRRSLEYKSCSGEELSKRPRSPEEGPESPKPRNERQPRRPVKSLRGESAPPKTSQDSSADSSTSMHEVVMAPEPKKPVFHPNPFDIYSLCPPSTLAENDPIAAKIKRKMLKKPEISHAVFKEALLTILEMIQEHRSQFMELLKDATNIIPNTEMDAYLSVIKPHDICSKMGMGDSQRRIDCMNASKMICNCLLEIQVSSLLAFEGQLLAGQFVAYLDVLQRTIESRNLSLTKDVNLVAMIRETVKYSIASSRSLKRALVLSLRVTLKGGAVFMTLLEDDNNAIPITEIIKLLISIDTNKICPRTNRSVPHDHADCLSAKLAILDFYSAIEMVFIASDKQLSVDQFKVHLEFLLEAIERRSPTSLVDALLIERIKKIVKDSTASNKTLCLIFSACLKVLLKEETELVTLLKGIYNVIPLIKIIEFMGSVSLRNICSMGDGSIFHNHIDCLNAREVMVKFYYMIWTTFAGSNRQLLVGQFVTFHRFLLRAIKDRG